MEELKADLRTKVEKRKNDSAQQSFETAVMNKVIEAAEMEIPDTMVEYELDKQMQNFEGRLAGSGMQLDQYLSMMGTNRAEFRENYRASAVHSIQNDLVLEAVVAAESIEASEDEITAEVEKLAADYSMEADAIRQAISQDQLAYGVKMDKASKLIFESAVVVPLDAAPVEAAEAAE